MAEELETINKFLRDQFGIDTEDSEPIFRVVWSEDQFENRQCKYTDSGIELLYPEVRRVPKYNYVRNVYILERRVLVPEINREELCNIYKSYEPLWVFVDRNDNPVRPTIEGCQFVIDCVYAALGKKSLINYKNPEDGMSPQELAEYQKAKVDKIEQDLFGDESGLKGETTTMSGSAIIVPPNYDKNVH